MQNSRFEGELAKKAEWRQTFNIIPGGIFHFAVQSQVSVLLNEKVETWTWTHITIYGIAGYESLNDCQMFDVTVLDFLAVAFELDKGDERSNT